MSPQQQSLWAYTNNEPDDRDIVLLDECDEQFVLGLSTSEDDV